MTFFRGGCRIILCRVGLDAKKNRGSQPRLSPGPSPWGLQHFDVGCLQALLALLDFELHALVFDQGLEARACDVTEVREQVGAACILSDEAEALALVEPLHGTGLGRHGRILSIAKMMRSTCGACSDTSDTIKGFLTSPRGIAEE